jgi:hypothetical protein
MAELTQHQKIIHILARFKGMYYKPSDFMRPELGKYYVGYEATARLSELAKKYPLMIETKQVGRFKARRLNMANRAEWWADCPADLKTIINLYQ